MSDRIERFILIAMIWLSVGLVVFDLAVICAAAITTLHNP